jgi:TonB family protein
MFQTSLTRRFWNRGERGPWAGSLAAALLLHLMLVAVLLRGIGTAPTAGQEETMWLLVGPPGPGGGVDELGAPGARTPQGDRSAAEPPAPEEEVEEESPVVEPLATPQDLVPDSLPMLTRSAAGDSAATGADYAPGIAVGGGGGRGGGAGGGITGGLGSGSGGQGAARPLHLVVPRIPRDVDKSRARGQSVHLLLQVLPDGSVGEVRVEKGSSMSVLDSAAVAAARQLRYSPPVREGVGASLWTRAEMRF